MKPARLLYPWDSTGKNTGVGGHFLLQGIFLTQRVNLGLLLCRQVLHGLSRLRGCCFGRQKSRKHGRQRGAALQVERASQEAAKDKQPARGGAHLADSTSLGVGSVPTSLPFPSVNVYLVGRLTLSVSGLRHLS